jgi:hypothetical protein
VAAVEWGVPDVMVQCARFLVCQLCIATMECFRASSVFFLLLQFQVMA